MSVQGYAEVLRQADAGFGPEDTAPALANPRRTYLKDRSTRSSTFQ